MNRRSILAAYKKKSSHLQTGVTGFKSGNLFNFVIFDSNDIDTMIYRTKKITVRLTDKEYAKLREMSETSGLKMEPVIRKLLVGYEIRPRPNAAYIKLIKELSAVGNNLNQIAHLANATGKITEDQWKETHQLLEKIWDFCAYEL